MKIFIYINDSLVANLDFEISEDMLFSECQSVSMEKFNLFLTNEMELSISVVENQSIKVTRRFDGDVVIKSRLPKKYLRDFKIKEIVKYNV